MIRFFKKNLSLKRITSIQEQATSAFEDGDYERGSDLLTPLIDAQSIQESIAECLIEIVEESYLTGEDGLEILNAIFESHRKNSQIVSLIGSALESVCNIDELNLEPPEHPLFQAVVSRLQEALISAEGEAQESILYGLATASRMMARQHDTVAGESYRKLVELSPSSPSEQYCLGLFCKTRGLFREGMEANQKGLDLLEEPLESYLWNLGICATGAGEGEKALEMWKSIGNKIDMGSFNLPEGRYPSCKVKLAEFPLAERSADNDYPGLQETIWLERLSPCHGIVRSVLYQDLGVDYGDVILNDGAPITHHTYGDTQVPVFPHLATLIKRNYQFFDFAAVQQERGQISDISDSLSDDSVVYVHTENYQVLCSTCWLDPNNNHQEHNREEKCIVSGRIAASGEVSPVELLEQIDSAIQKLPDCQIFAPELCDKAGLSERAQIESRRFNLLVENT